MAAVITGVNLDTTSLEQIVAEQESVQQHTAEQIVHVPTPQIWEQIEEIVQVEEQIVNIPDPPIVEEIVDVVQIYSVLRSRLLILLCHRSLKRSFKVMRLRTTEQIAQELLMGSAAGLDRSTSFCYQPGSTYRRA